MQQFKAVVTVLALLPLGQGVAQQSPSRMNIVPKADHHQHVVGPAAVAWLTPVAPLQPITLPPDLARLISAREKASGTQDIGI